MYVSRPELSDFAQVEPSSTSLENITTHNNRAVMVKFERRW